MKFLFWFSLALIFFAYAGYPICLYIRAKLWPRPVLRGAIFPRVAMVMAVHNEEKTLAKKLDNLAQLDYPADRLEIIVVSDGSIDQTNNILREWQNAGRRAVILPHHQGKATALNHGVAAADADIICFIDARQIIARNALKNLIANFADQSVGCVSGELVLRDKNSTSSSGGVGLYWHLEKQIRNWEAVAGSTVGATGAFYAVRRELLVALPAGTILDDVFIPMQVAREGKRVVFDPQAVIWDDFTPSPQQEFHRKVRTLAGNYQLLQLAPWLLTGSNPLRLQFICHKLLRLMVPVALAGVFISTLWCHTGVYGLALVLQIVFYALALLTALRTKIGFLSRLSNISLAFVVLNTAAVVALAYFITGRKAAWVR